MVITTTELLRVVCAVAEESNILVTVREAAEGTALTGVVTLSGAVLLGPFGFLIGGGAGAIMAYYWKKDKFKSLIEVIKHDLTDAQREKLAAGLYALISTMILDITLLNIEALLRKNEEARRAVQNMINEFLQTQTQIT